MWNRLGLTWKMLLIISSGQLLLAAVMISMHDCSPFRKPLPQAPNPAQALYTESIYFL